MFTLECVDSGRCELEGVWKWEGMDSVHGALGCGPQGLGHSGMQECEDTGM